MAKTTVIFMDKATPATLTEFKDAVSSSIISIESNWALEFRTYRSQVKKKLNNNNNNSNVNDSNTNIEEEQNESDRNNVLYSLSFPQKKKNVLIKNGIAIVTTTSFDVDNENTDSGTSNVRKLIDSSSSVWYPEQIDNIISNKLSNMWIQRQLIKGDAGESFITQDGLLIKCCNLFSSFGFKGLLIELKEAPLANTIHTTSIDDNSHFTFCVKAILDILKTIGIKTYKISKDTLNKDTMSPINSNRDENAELCDLAYQYVNVLD